ncbi:PulJ/GspJ family protein [Glaciimonas sp. GG7]
MRTRDQRQMHGFTLVELIVAIAILALVAVLGWRGLDGIVRARVALSAQMEQTSAMQLTFAQLQSDAAHLAPASLMLVRPTLLATQNRLLLVRMVFADQQPVRVQIVDYRLRDGVLTRAESPATRDLKALDGMWRAAISGNGDASIDASIDAAQPVILQSDIAIFTMQVWDNAGQNWLPAEVTGTSAQDSLTAVNRWTGLQVTLQLRGTTGNMMKTFLLGSA